jgi:alcohol dehydrogenase class IV
MRTEEYVTLFPSPLHFHKPSALTHIAEGQAALQSRAHPEESAWSGRRGLGTTNLAAGMFGFQGPKILMGRGIAATAIRDTLKSLRLRWPLLVTGQGGLHRQAHLWEAAFAGLTDPSGVAYDYAANAVTVSGEPTVEDAQRITAFAVSQGCDSVLAVGGGSALDIGKAVAALVPNSHRDIFDFLEVIGRGQPLDRDPLPLIAVPTTSGTGSEATKNAVLKSVAHGLKVSIRHDKMFPVAAVLDPLLTLSCPPGVTAHVGMDTLCQCLEPYLCCVPNPFVDALAREVSGKLLAELHCSSGC